MEMITEQEIIERTTKARFDSNQQIEYLDLIEKFDENNLNTLKLIFDIYEHPSKGDVDNYFKDPAKKFPIGMRFADIDDLTYLKCINYHQKMPIQDFFNKSMNFLKMVLKYEKLEKKHIHKGAIYYNLHLIYLQIGVNDLALLNIHKAFIDDDMKHYGIENFPRTYSYKFIVLDETCPNPFVKDLKTFVENDFLEPNYTFKEFYDNFLNKASNLSKDEHKWLDHIVFFNNFLIKLERVYRLSEDIYNSILGELNLSSIIGDFCLLIESICKLKLNLKGAINKIYFDSRDPNKGLNFLYKWSANFITSSDFDDLKLESTLKSIFSNSYNGSSDSLENSFYLTWGLRNNFHHNINSIKIISKNFKQIIKKQMEFFLDFTISK
jgi:hypothetical protein